MQRLFLSLALLSLSCGLLRPKDAVCEPGSPATCDGQELSSCVDGFLNTTTCPAATTCDAATLSCVVSFCGDGVVNADEECDDGNRVNADQCEANCSLPKCGNGVVDTVNTIDTNNDGTPDLREQCDDLCGGDGCTEAADNGDGCDSQCQDELCGDGIVQDDLGELCDDGKSCSDGTSCVVDGDCPGGDACIPRNGDSCNASCVGPCQDGQPDADVLCLPAAPQILDTDNDLACILAADLDQDGDVDILTCANFLQAFLNDGNGGFEIPFSVAAGLNPSAAVVQDLDGDGRVDMAVTNRNGGSVSLFHGELFAFANQVEYDIGNGGVPSLAVADFTGDGKPDIAVTTDTNPGSVVVMVNRSDSDGSFDAADFPTAEFTVIEFSAFLKQIVADDFNRDGRPDLAIASQGTDELTILATQPADVDGKPVFVKQTATAEDGPRTLTAKDFNGDGLPDILVGHEFGAGLVSIFLNIGGNFFGHNNTISLVSVTGVASGDLDGDGDQDILASSGLPGAGTEMFLGVNNLQDPQAILVDLGDGVRAIASADLNQDGIDDVIAGLFSTLQVFISEP